MCQEASSNCVGHMPYFLCSLCLSKSKPCYYQPLKKTWLSVTVFICYWKPFFASILPFIPCIDTTIDVLFSCDFLCPQTFLLSCCILVEVNVRTSVASLKLCGKFEISGFFCWVVFFFSTFFLPCFSCTPSGCSFWVLLWLLSQMDNCTGNYVVATRKTIYFVHTEEICPDYLSFQQQQALGVLQLL